MARLRLAERARHLAGRELFIKLWLVPAWIGLGLASLAITTLAFKRIAPRLGTFCGLTKPIATASANQERRARQIGRTVQLAARYAPWRSDCYPQAIVARLLLGIYRLPFAVSMGIKRDAATGEAMAHAWVECGQISVTGGDGGREYSVVAVFACQGRR